MVLHQLTDKVRGDSRLRALEALGVRGWAAMRALVVRLLVNGAGLWVATLLVDGVSLEAGSTAGKIVTLVVVAAIFGLVNAVIKPVVKVLAFPLYLLSLGLLTFVVNALLFWLTAWISGKTGLDYRVDGFWSALLGALVVSVVSFALNAVLRDERRRASQSH